MNTEDNKTEFDCSCGFCKCGLSDSKKLGREVETMYKCCEGSMFDRRSRPQ